MEQTQRAQDTRLTMVLVGLPVAIGVVGVLLARSWRSDLPDPVATHWGLSGPPDGYSPLNQAIWLAGLGSILGLVIGATMLALAARVPEARRGGAAVVAGSSTLVTSILVGTLAIQRGIDDASRAPGVGAVLGVSFMLAAIMAVLGAWSVGSLPSETLRAYEPIPANAPRAELEPGVEPLWTGVARSTPWVYIVVALVAIPLIVIAVSGGYAFVIIVSLAFAGLLMAATSSFRVRVDRQGIAVRSVLGWPGWTLPLSDIAEARAVDIDPLREFGGVGLRAGRDSRFGVVLRKGPALEIRRGNGSAFVVTVDGADEAAALANALADEARS